jgi:ActR/RegA family two-component response regulator
MPCTVPSSPGVPCSALNTTSGAASARRNATSRPMSIRVTRWPRCSSALATPSPLVSETGRSLDQPPISTAT